MANLAFFGEPRVPRLSKLLEEIRAGEIRVSRFQRPFVWTDEQRLALMESIYSGYPIGAILVWRTQKHRLGTYDHFGPLRLPPETGEDTTRQYLLDGHQRLTTLFAALGPALYRRGDGDEPAWLAEDEEERARWPIYFDLSSDPAGRQDANPFRLTRRQEQPPPTWLPLDILFDSYALREREEELREKKHSRELVNRVQAVADTFRDYTIPVMPIATEDLGRVTTSFQRVNSGGTPMSEVHMVNALTYGPEFDFLERIEEVAAELKPVGWSSFDPQMILNICKPRLLLALYDEDPEELANKLKADTGILNDVRDDIIKVAGVLDKVAGVRGPASLPYSYQAVLLADALRGWDSSPPDEILANLRTWFWATTLGEYFRGMTTSLFERARQHLQGLMRGAADARPPGMASVIDPIGRFDFRSARARGLSLLLAEQNPAPLDIRPGDAFDLLAEHGSDALTKLVVEREVEDGDRHLVHGVGNRFLVHPRTSGILQGLKQGPALFPGRSHLASHLVDHDAQEALWKHDWRKLLQLRRDALERLERQRAEECGLAYRQSA